MSVIEFSGLVTGLDTNSWVSALTALKNAKVQELEAEKAAVVELKDVVSGIKTFFSSFRTSLERLTDARLGVDAMDIFVQNLANSSDPSKVTATATHTASRDTYEVGVTQLASATKVNTAIRKTFTMTYTADMDTKLSILGVKEGYVSVNEKEIKVENSDTISTLIDKLADIGVTATYDEGKGRFTIETDIFEVDEGTTNVFGALGLTFKDITGVSSGELRVEGYVTIKPTTLLSDIGATGGNIMINKTVENLTFNSGDTIQTFLDYMNNKYGAGTATMDSGGFITISGVDIEELRGGSNIITALGLTETVDTVTSSSDRLYYDNTEFANANTALGNLNTTFSNYRLILGNGSSTQTVNLSSTSTLGDIINQIETYAANNGMNADIELTNQGAIIITGDIDKLYISGGIADGLGLKTDTVNGTTLTGSHMEYSITYTAKTSTTFGDLGISGSNLTYNVLNERGETLAANLNVTSTTTIENWFDSMKQYGISASISEEGVISVDGGIISGNLATALGLSSVVSGEVISETSAESNALAGTTTIQATMTSSLQSLGITSNQTLTINVNGTNTTRNFTGTSTLQDVADAIAAAGGEMSIKDGELSISGVDKLSGSLVSSLNLDENTIQGTSMYNTNLAYTMTSIATEATQFSHLGITNLSFAVYDEEGNLQGNVNLASTSTVGDFINRLGTYGLSANIDENGVISLEGGYITGNLANSLGLSYSADHTYVSKTTIQSNALMGTITTTASMTSSLADFGINSTQYLTIRDMGTTTVHSFTSASTLQDISNAIKAAGGEFTFENNQIYITGIDNISGSLLTGLGLTAVQTGNATSIYSADVKYTLGGIATEASKLADYGISPSGKTYNIYALDGTVLGSNLSLSADASVGDLISSLTSKGLNAYIDSTGRISITNGYITGSMATALGFSSNNYQTNVVSVTQVSGTIEAQLPVTATLDTTFAQLGYSGTYYLTINNDGTNSTYTFDSSSTIASISYAVASAGGSFELLNGAISISGVEISGSLATSLGIDHKAGSVQQYTTTSTSITSTTVINGGTTSIEQIITTITTTLTSTDTFVYRSDIKSYEITTSNFDVSTTKLSQLGVTNGTVNLYNGSTNSTTAIFTVTTDSTVGAFITALEINGVTARYADGELTLTADEDLQLREGTSNLFSHFGFTNTIVYETLTQNSTSSVLNNFTTHNLTSTTALSLVTSSTSEITLNINGETVSRVFVNSDTIQDVIYFIESQGITASLNNGTFSASSAYQEFSISGSLASVILGENPSFTTTSRPTAWSGTVTDKEESTAINGDTKLVHLGVTTGDIKIYDNGTLISTAINISENTTINDLISSLSNYGFTASLSGGRLNITADSEMYLMDETSNLATKLGLTKSYEYNTVYQSSTSSSLAYTTVRTIGTSTTLADMGFEGGSDLRLIIDGTVHSIGFTGSETIQDVLDALNVYGINAAINNGSFTASSTEHTFSITGELGAKLASSSPVTSTITTVTGYTTTLPQSVNRVTINEDAKLVDLGVTQGGIKIYDNGTWINTVINIDQNTTIGDFLTALEGYGFTANLDGNKIKISTDSDKYIADESSNIVSKLGLTNRTQTKVNIYDQTNSNTLTMVRTYELSDTTTLNDLGFASGTSLRLELDGVLHNIGFTADDTIGEVVDSLNTFDIHAELQNGILTASTEDKTFYLIGSLADILTGGAPTYITTEKVLYHETESQSTGITYVADSSSKLSDLGVETGYINVLQAGEIISTIAIRDDTKVSQLFSALAAYGIAGNISTDGRITIQSVGDVTLLDGTSNLVSHLGLDDNIYSNTYYGTTLVLEDDVNVATEDTLVSYYDTPDKKAEGSVYLAIEDQDGNVTNTVINIEANDTFGTLVEKLEEAGISASFENGKISYHNGMGSVEITGGTSSIADTLGFGDAVLEQWMQNDVEITYEQDEIRYLSVVNYADNSTTLETLGVSDGEFSIGINGSIINVNVAATDTLANVMSRISSASNGSVTASITSDGKFMLEAAEGVELIIGTSTDTTNLVTIFNLTQDGSNVITGNTSLYRASSTSKITDSGLFREGDVTEGTFTIGNAEFTITSETTIASLINDINHSEAANANAYWDNINGKMILTSASLGSSYVNIQGGTSNFTEIFGLTINDNGEEKLTTYNQDLGDNAILTINGTRIVSTSNTITSDISRIEGLTVNIKGITEGEYVTITVERDTQSIVDAVQETLDAYNTLIAELNTVLAIGGDLHNDTALKSIKNQITSMFTSRGTNGVTLFRNLSAIGISTESASSAMPSDIYSLYLDTEKFENALNTSEDEVKLLLVGTDANPGILTKVETIIEQMLTTTGYFQSKSKALDREIDRYDVKIERAQRQADSYKTMLENKFQSMEMLYSNMQSAYQNVFSGGL